MISKENLALHEAAKSFGMQTAQPFMQALPDTREGLAEIFAPYGIGLDYDRDVLPRSQAAEGGSVTERHILFALAVLLLFMAAALIVYYIRWNRI